MAAQHVAGPVVDRSGRSGSSALRKVSKFGTVASHQDRLPAYRSGALSRSGLERVNSAVEWHTQNRCFRTRKIVRIRGAHKGDGAGMQLVVREISHLVCPRIQPLSSIVRHLPSDEDEIVANDGRHETRTGGRADTRRIDFVDLMFRHHGDQRSRDSAIRTEAVLHHHRGARRNVIAEFSVSGEVIGIDGSRGRIILVEANAVAQVGPKFPQDAPHSLQDEITLGSAARPPEQREARWASHLLGDAALEFGGLSEAHPEIAAANIKTLVELAGQGKLKPRIWRRFPLAAAAEAIQALIDRKVIGKAVLVG